MRLSFNIKKILREFHFISICYNCYYYGIIGKGVDIMNRLRNVRKRWWIVAIVSLVLLMIDVALLKGIAYYYPDVWEKEKKAMGFEVKASDTQLAIKEALKGIELHSKNAILIDMSDQQTLFEKNGDERIYPASLTKVLTAIVALDLKQDLQEVGTVSDQDLLGLAAANASVAGFKPGDTITYEQALYALLLPSGADAANFLGNHMSGSVENFVNSMNKKAKSLGMLNTHFNNPTGLHEDNHYTTLNDMKKMMVLGWKNPVFQEIITTFDYTIPPIMSHPEGMRVKSTLVSYGGSLQFNGGEIIGGKSGYTLEAQCCLISIAKMSDGHLYMFISTNAGGQPSTDRNHLKDAHKVYEMIHQVTTTK